MRSTLLSRRDLDFLLYEWLDVEGLTARERFADHSRETFDGVLDLCEQVATKYFAPHNKLNDANEPTFDGDRVTIIPEVATALDAFAKADLLGMTFDNQVRRGAVAIHGRHSVLRLVPGGERRHVRLSVPHAR
jgi:hypothetical protein